jgi:hypothetical protein
MIIKVRNPSGPVGIEFEGDEGGMLFCPPGLVGPGTEQLSKAPPCPRCNSAVFAFWVQSGPSFEDGIAPWEPLRIRMPVRINRLVPCLHEVETCRLIRREGGPQNVWDVSEWVVMK